MNGDTYTPSSDFFPLAFLLLDAFAKVMISKQWHKTVTKLFGIQNLLCTYSYAYSVRLAIYVYPQR